MKHRRAGEYKCSILVKEEAGQRRLSWLMGDPFLRAYYSIYDMENDRIGLVGVAETLRSPIPDEEEEGAEDYILPEPAAGAVEKVSDGVKGIAESLGLDPEDDEHVKIVAILLICVGVCLLCCLCNCIIYKCK